MNRLSYGTAAVAVLAAVAGFGGAASAADVEYTAPPAYSWSGFYVGGYIGAGASVTRSEVNIDDVVVFTDDGIGGDGFIGGALAGFNWQASERFVLGIQGDIGWTDMDGDGAISVIDADGPEFIASASLRAGFLVTPETMFYLIGGYSYAEYQFEFDDDTDFDENFDGFHAGFGMETRLTDRLTARVEYRYTEFGSENRDLLDGIVDIEERPSVHTGTLGIAYNLFPTAGAGEVASPAADVVEPRASWTGFYIGVNGGAGAAVSDLESEGGEDVGDSGGESVLGSLMAGFNWQAGERFVLGIQGDIGLADLESEQELEVIGIIVIEDKQKLDWFASASLRAGWLPSPDTMIYVIGGYSYAHYELESDISLGGQSVINLKDNQDYDGYHVGTGIEAMLTDNVTARVEYRFTQYGRETWDESFFGVDSAKPSTHTGTIGIAWLFNDW